MLELSRCEHFILFSVLRCGTLTVVVLLLKSAHVIMIAYFEYHLVHSLSPFSFSFSFTEFVYHV